MGAGSTSGLRSAGRRSAGPYGPLRWRAGAAANLDDRTAENAAPLARHVAARRSAALPRPVRRRGECRRAGGRPRRRRTRFPGARLRCRRGSRADLQAAREQVLDAGQSSVAGADREVQPPSAGRGARRSAATAVEEAVDRGPDLGRDLGRSMKISCRAPGSSASSPCAICADLAADHAGRHHGLVAAEQAPAPAASAAARRRAAPSPRARPRSTACSGRRAPARDGR